MLKEKKLYGLIAILFMYIIAIASGIIIYIFLPFNFYINLLISDVFATIIIFIFSIIFIY